MSDSEKQSPWERLDALARNRQGPNYCPQCGGLRKAASRARAGWSLLWCEQDHYWYVTALGFEVES